MPAIPDKRDSDFVELRWPSTCSVDSIPYSGDRTVADADLTILILRELQTDIRQVKSDVRELKTRISSIEEKHEVTNERLSMVERGVTFVAAHVNVMRRNLGVEDRKSDEIRDLQVRVAKLEDLVKP
jgi:hypothetical protein